MGLIDFPGVVALGLGLYAKFGSEGEPVHPLLANDMVVNGLIVSGVVIMILAGARMLRLVAQRNKLRGKRIFNPFFMPIPLSLLIQFCRFQKCPNQAFQ